MKVYSYQRVSSKEQNLARQEEAFEKWAEENNIKDYEFYSDKQSGKNFERENYQRMIEKLNKGDLVVIKSIDRLGRNYDLIIQEWTKITKVIEADIVVIDMPLLDTRDKKASLTGKFISDIVLQLLSYVAETERNNIKIRQAEGITIAKKNGVKFGATSKLTDEIKDGFKEDYLNNIPIASLMEKYKISKATVISWAKEFGLSRYNKKSTIN